MKFLVTAAVVAAIVSASFVAPADARKYTIYQRQAALKTRIAKAERAKELTYKEARNFKDDLSEVQTDKRRYMDKNNGKLSYEDISKLEKKLNRISAGVQKRALEKRVD
jgi:hypothetical protein